MPIGAPSHMPAPKSGCMCRVVPIVETQAAELAATGSPSTRAFQMLSTGKIEHPPMAGPAAPAG
jgi:hypothetical protein